MTVSNYYFVESQGREQGPLLASEILALAKAGLLLPSASLRNQHGEKVSLGELETIEREACSPGADSPPPLRPADQGAEKAPFLTTRRMLIILAFALFHWFFKWRHVLSPQSNPKSRISAPFKERFSER